MSTMNVPAHAEMTTDLNRVAAYVAFDFGHVTIVTETKVRCVYL